MYISVPGMFPVNFFLNFKFIIAYGVEAVTNDLNKLRLCLAMSD